jgi:hypothetical protein
MAEDHRTGVWSYTTPLPSGVFTYGFYINCPDPSGQSCTEVSDPGNPLWNTLKGASPRFTVWAAVLRTCHDLGHGLPDHLLFVDRLLDLLRLGEGCKPANQTLLTSWQICAAGGQRSNRALAPFTSVNDRGGCPTQLLRGLSLSLHPSPSRLAFVARPTGRSHLTFRGQCRH